MTREVYVAAVARTPIGSLAGSLSSLTAPQLGSIAIRAALEKAKVSPQDVDEVIMGNVLSGGVGQNPARQAALGAGLPQKVVCTGVNKVCASGMKAVIIAAQAILLGTAEIVVAGGMESMSNTPYYLPKARGGMRYGNAEVVDGIVRDGLSDAYDNSLMGMCAELIASDHQLTREMQDDFALSSYRRAQEAQKSGHFDGEIVPVEIQATRGGKPTLVTVDEEASKPINEEKFRSLPAAFKKVGGTVTAPNSSTISDGAAALVLVSGDKARELGLPVVAKIRGWGEAEQAPEYFTTSPSLAIPKAIKHAGISPTEIDYYEINEAFSAVALANQKILGLDAAKLNVYGGAVSLGHPLGCSGARIVATLSSVLRNNKAKMGVAAVCNGGGGASALVIERVDSVAKASL